MPNNPDLKVNLDPGTKFRLDDVAFQPFEEQLQHAAAIHQRNFLLRKEIEATRRLAFFLLSKLGGTVAISAQTLEQLPDTKISITHDPLTDAYVISCKTQTTATPTGSPITEEPSLKLVPIDPTDGAPTA